MIKQINNKKSNCQNSLYMPYDLFNVKTEMNVETGQRQWPLFNKTLT